MTLVLILVVIILNLGICREYFISPKERKGSDCSYKNPCSIYDCLDIITNTSDSYPTLKFSNGKFYISGDRILFPPTAKTIEMRGDSTSVISFNFTGKFEKSVFKFGGMEIKLFLNGMNFLSFVGIEGMFDFQKAGFDLSIVNTSFDYCYPSYGILYNGANFSSLTILNSNFSNSGELLMDYRKFSGGVATVDISNSRFSDGSSVIYFQSEDEVKFSFENCSVAGYTSTSDVSLFYVESIKTKATVKNSDFKHITYPIFLFEGTTDLSFCGNSFLDNIRSVLIVTSGTHYEVESFDGVLSNNHFGNYLVSDIESFMCSFSFGEKTNYNLQFADNVWKNNRMSLLSIEGGEISTAEKEISSNAGVKGSVHFLRDRMEGNSGNDSAIILISDLLVENEIEIVMEDVVFSENAHSVEDIYSFSPISIKVTGMLTVKFIGGEYVNNKGIDGGVLNIIDAPFHSLFAKSVTVFMKKSRFFGNCATEKGGVVSVVRMGSGIKLIIDDSKFQSNKALYGGAIYFYALKNSSILNISDSEISSNNVGEGYGGGLFVNLLDSSPDSFLFLERKSKFNNISLNSARSGGGVYFEGSYPKTYEKSNLFSNSASEGKNVVTSPEVIKCTDSDEIILSCDKEVKCETPKTMGFYDGYNLLLKYEIPDPFYVTLVFEGRKCDKKTKITTGENFKFELKNIEKNKLEGEMDGMLLLNFKTEFNVKLKFGDSGGDKNSVEHFFEKNYQYFAIGVGVLVLLVILCCSCCLFLFALLCLFLCLCGACGSCGLNCCGTACSIFRKSGSTSINKGENKNTYEKITDEDTFLDSVF